MKVIAVFFTIIFSVSWSFAQDSELALDFFKDISEAPASYDATSVAMRMVEGLGFRFYWGTDGLSEADYEFAASEETRTIGETLDHIVGLSNVVLNATHGRANASVDMTDMSYAEKRNLVLTNLFTARMKLSNSSDSDMESMDIIFKRGDSERRYDFWFAINGPISDAIWHVGQIVGYRRMAGNPFNGKVSVLTGSVRP